jgi:hypothetical protein
MPESNGHNGAAHTEIAQTRRLTVSDILAASDITEEEVEVPEWGGSVRIRGFTKVRQQELRRMATDPRNGKIDGEKLEMQIFIYGVIDPKFEPVQQTELKEKSAGALDRVLKRILAISGMSEDAVEEAVKSVSD